MFATRVKYRDEQQKKKDEDKEKKRQEQLAAEAEKEQRLEALREEVKYFDNLYSNVLVEYPTDRSLCRTSVVMFAKQILNPSFLSTLSCDHSVRQKWSPKRVVSEQSDFDDQVL